MSELRNDSYLVAVKQPKIFPGERFRTDAKCADGYVVLAGWELDTRRWFSLRALPSDAPSGPPHQQSCLHHWQLWRRSDGWDIPMRENRSRCKSFGGTDNRSNEALTKKRATTKWPLMAINMQLSASLSRARWSLVLKWRPREESVEADDLTNEKFSSFVSTDRVHLGFGDLDLSLLRSLVDSRQEFETKKQEAKAAAGSDPRPKQKRFDKTPW